MPPQTPVMPSPIVSQSTTLQRIVRPATVETSPLYWRLSRPGSAMPVDSSDEIDLDTYFNSFDEAIWRRYTRIGTIGVELEISGKVRVLLWRHTRQAPPALLAEARAEGRAAMLRITVPPPAHPCGAGRLCLTVVAEADDTALLSGRWTTMGSASAVRLTPVLCTFNRDAPLAALLHRLADDDDVPDLLEEVIVVNNGKPGLAARLGVAALPAPLRDRLVIIEQPNLGGAGGFTRGLLAATDRGATHALLMDDDVALEPESLLRAHAFYGFASRDVVLAGHMLDMFRPTHLYEAGARINDARLWLEPLHFGAELAPPGALNRFLEPAHMHYGAWWFLGLPLALLEQHGWPMPCFIRGDDVEFGRRMHNAGVPQVSMPGLGIWHEPFYAKNGGWHTYYEMRNMLVLACQHLPGTARNRARAVLRMILTELMIFRYRRAALLIKAAEDFLSGPGIFDVSPQDIHASLDPILRRYPAETVPQERVMAERAAETGPRSRTGFAVRLAAAVAGEWIRPVRGTVISVAPQDHVWFRLRGVDGVAVRESWEAERPLFRRSRAAFRDLLAHAVRLAWRMLREMGPAEQRWRDAFPHFTSEAAWRAYFEAHSPDPAVVHEASMKVLARAS